MKKTKKAISLILAFAMIFTAMLGCMTVSSFAGTEGQSAEGPKLVDYSIEIGNDDPPTYSGSYFIVNLEFDKTIKVANDSWILNGFNISVSGSDLTSKNFQFKKFEVSDKTLSLYIETAPEKVAMLVNGRVDISLKSNYYDAITSTDGTQIPSDGWTDISTVVPTGLKFIPGDVNTGDDSSNASKTFAVEGKAIMRGATPVQIAIGDEVITVNIHTHSFIEQTNEYYAGILAKNFNDAVAEKEGFSYEMEADGSSVILKSKAQGADENIENAQVRTFEYTAPNDEIVQSAWLAETITSAEDRSAKIAESNSVAQSRKDALKDAIEKAKSLTSADMNCALDWQKAIAELQSAVDGAQDNAIETTSATRSNGTVNLSLTGGEEWIKNAKVTLDGTELSAEEYSFSDGTLSISSLAFDTEGETTPKTKSYTVSIISDGYADVTQTVEVNFYGASTFTIRLLDKNNKVVKERTYTKDEIIAYSEKEETGGKDHLFSTACSMTGSRVFKGSGAYLTTLIKEAGITEDSDFNPAKTTVKFRTNDSNDETDKNDDPTVDSYFSMINTPYEELMSPRYYFQDLYDHDSDLYKVYAESANINKDDDDAVAEHNLKLRKAMAASEKVEVQPMVAYQFSEDPNVDLDDVPLSDPTHANYAYDPALAKDKSFRFLLGTGMTTENGQELSSTLNTTMRSTYQLYGIDLADSSIEVEDSGTIETTEAERSNGTVNLNLQGDGAWLAAIEENGVVKVDGVALSKEDYTIADGVLKIASLKFGDAENTPRFKDYNIAIEVPGYAIATQTVKVKFYGASTFTIRLLDKNNKVVKSKTYTKEDIINYAQDSAKGGQQKLFSTACSMTGSRAFKGDGAYLSTLIEDAGIIEGSDFTPSTTTVKFRVNDMNDSEINDDPTIDSYFRMINTGYEELMSPRYYFQDLYDHDSDLYKVYAESANINKDDDDAVAEHNLKLRKAMAASEKVEVQPMVAYQFSEDPNVDLDDVPLSDPTHENCAYDQNLAADKGFRFLLGTGMVTDEETGEVLASTLNTTMRSTFQLYGIDLYDESLPASSSGGGGGGGSAVTNYTVTFDSNGGSSVAKQTVASGKTVSKPADPTKEGYTFGGWYTDKELTEAYDFGTTVKKSITLYAKWNEEGEEPGTEEPGTEPGTGAAGTFTDVAADSWYAEYVTYLADKGIVNGKTETTFEPNSNITRAEFIKIIAGVAGADVSGASSSKFSDVAAGSWYAPYVAWGVENGLINGVSDTSFDPNGRITRQDMATLISRYADFAKFELPQTVTPVEFADGADIASYAKDAVAEMQKAGIINGKDANRFAPEENATRAEACKMLTILMQQMGK